MSSERMKTEEFWNQEHIVEKFWNGLKEGTIYARKCKECGAIEFHRILRATAADIMRRNGQL